MPFGPSSMFLNVYYSDTHESPQPSQLPLMWLKCLSHGKCLLYLHLLPLNLNLFLRPNMKRANMSVSLTADGNKKRVSKSCARSKAKLTSYAVQGDDS